MPRIEKAFILKVIFNVSNQVNISIICKSMPHRSYNIIIGEKGIKRNIKMLYKRTWLRMSNQVLWNRIFLIYDTSNKFRAPIDTLSVYCKQKNSQFFFIALCHNLYLHITQKSQEMTNRAKSDWAIQFISYIKLFACITKETFWDRRLKKHYCFQG